MHHVDVDGVFEQRAEFFSKPRDIERNAVESDDQFVPGEIGGKLVDVVAAHVRFEPAAVEHSAHRDVRLAAETCRFDVEEGRLIGEVG